MYDTVRCTFILVRAAVGRGTAVNLSQGDTNNRGRPILRRQHLGWEHVVYAVKAHAPASFP